MFQSAEELAQAIGRANLEYDLDRLIELENCFQVSQDPGPLPLTPKIEFNQELVSATVDAQESDRVLGLANALSRSKRRLKYMRRKWSDFSRPVIVSEGDSWFQYPIRLDDVIDVLMEDYLVLSLGAAGDLLADMSSQAEYLAAIRSEDADFFLVSGGGNDMLHSGRLAEYLKPFESGMTPEQAVDPGRWEPFLDELRFAYQSIFEPVLAEFPRIKILCHGYDYALPRTGGKWLGDPLAQRGVPKRMWNDVVRVLIDGFNRTLSDLADGYGSRVIHVDCRNAVGSTVNSWYDELHPKDTGYKRVADLFREKIEEHGGQGAESLFQEMATPMARPTARHRPVAPSLPSQVLRQVVAGRSHLAQPSTAIVSNDGGMALDEAIIQSGMPNVGPLLRPTPNRRAVADPAQPLGPPTPRRINTRTIIHDVLQHGELPQAESEREARQTQSETELLRESPCSSLAAWHAHLNTDPTSISSYNDYEEVRRNYEEAEVEARVHTRLELLPENDTFFQERIIGRSNLEQINFLARGERAARTVGRLSILSEYGIPAGTGSGFLVGPGLLLTNHHVLSNHQCARSGSYVLFDYEYDADNRLKSAERFDLTSDLFYTDSSLDFTFVSVAPVGSRGSRIEEFGSMMLIRESGKALKGEAVSIIQHPSGLPKQIAIRDSTVVGRKGAFIYYYADTNRGSSGSPVVNDQWFPVALHHRSVPDYYNPCQYVANRGIRISEIYACLEHAAHRDGSEMAERILKQLKQRPKLPQLATPSSTNAGEAIERLVEPFHELPYDNRKGYDDEFLGVRVPMPMVKDVEGIAAPRIDEGGPRYLLTYEHFSIVMHRHRRLAAFTAANVDRSPEKRKPEPGRAYGRRALGGLEDNEREKWFEDPRITSAHQLPDHFFNEDRQAFDKGHLTMRAEVAWGNDYDEVRRANGDSYHVTNCSPQVAEFNRSSFGFTGPWGELEEVVLAEAADEKLCVFAGPIFSPHDRVFRGEDLAGEAMIKIPSAYWKIIFARTGEQVEAFAFILEQDLTDVAFEFELPSEWHAERTSVADVESRVGILRFPPEWHAADGS